MIFTTLYNIAKFFKPFIHIILPVACIGSVLSGLIAYEQNSLLKLISNVNYNNTHFQQITIIASITAFSGLRIYGINYLKNKVYINIINYFFNKICSQKLEHWDVYYSRSELVKCVHTDIFAIAESGSRIFSIIIRNVIGICVISYLLYYEHIFYLLFGLSICIIRSYYLEKLAKKWEIQHDKLNIIKRQTEDYLTEYINNIDHMQIYGINKVYQTYIDNSLYEFNIQQQKESSILAIFMTSFSAVTKFIDIGMFFVTSFIQNNLSPLQQQIRIQLLLSYLKSLTESFQGISDIPKIIKQNKDSYLRINKYFGQDNLVSRFSNSPSFLSKSPNIHFKNITFTYPTKKLPVFSNLDIFISYGSKIIFKGPSGMGKSTLIKLLLGLYTPQQGHVLINELDSSTINNTTDIISIVPQEPIILYNKSLAENLLIFTKKSYLNDNHIKNVLDIVELSQFSNSIHDKLVNLSGGQKQRLSIARAILSDNPIIILDEPFSAMDYTLKISLQYKLFDLWNNKTIILITHDTDIPKNFIVKSFYSNNH